jgi:hypothetical protein
VASPQSKTIPPAGEMVAPWSPMLGRSLIGQRAHFEFALALAPDIETKSQVAKST